MMPLVLDAQRWSIKLEQLTERLAVDGFGLHIWDAYRPRRATQDMIQWAESRAGVVDSARIFGS